jgi:Zn-finger nucleic acid-binding protein
LAEVPRGKYIGEQLGEGPASEAEHFIKCPACGGWIDRRDLGHVLDHEGPLPHPAQDRPQ